MTKSSDKTEWEKFLFGFIYVLIGASLMACGNEFILWCWT